MNPSDHPFKFVTVLTSHNSAALQWNIHPDLDVSAPLTFTVQMSQGTSEWENVGSVVNNYIIMLSVIPYWGKVITKHFRVRLVDGDGATYYSNPIVLTQLWTRRDFLIAKEIARRYGKMLDKYTGEPGLLLKRKAWGVRCSACQDTTWSQPNTSFCPNCYGTGFEGGYFSPVFYPIMADPNQKSWDRQEGTNDPRAGRSGLALNVPVAEAKDLWIDTATGKRFEILSLQPVDTHRGAVLTVTVSMATLPPSDPAYEVEINGTT